MGITTLTRGASGTLFLNGVETILRGGSYDLFRDPRRCPEGIGNRVGGVFEPHVVEYGRGVNPCQKGVDKTSVVEVVIWNEGSSNPPQPGDFKDFFDWMAETRCNFVRVFLGVSTLTRSGRPVSINPFHFESGKYDVENAVEHGRWRAGYFKRLRSFVDAADEKGVVVQLSLFNYRELDPDGWGLSPWNAANAPGGAWATEHLIPAGTAPHPTFIAPPPAGRPGSGLRRVQEALVVRVMEALRGCGNVVLEVMNEPRGVANVDRIAEFDSFVAGAIVRNREVTGCPALISVNASIPTRVTPDPANPELRDRSDVDAWKELGLEHYDALDLVSYHQLTCFALMRLEFPPPEEVCRGSVMAPRLDAEAIQTRRRWHVDRHRAKAVILSTDAVDIRKFTHGYPDEPREMNIREGQILPKPEGTSLEAQLLRNHVFLWAKRCLVRRMHFHNDATFRLPLLRIAQAAHAAGLQPATVEETDVYDPV